MRNDYEDAFRRRLRALDLEPLAEQLAPHVAACLEVTSTEVGSGPLGACRIGGSPDLPSSIPWPTSNGAAMSFVAQLDLDALPADWIDGMPTDGWLYFFVGEDRETERGHDHHVVHYAGPRSTLVATTCPSPETHVFRACLPRFERSVVIGADRPGDDVLGEGVVNLLEPLSPVRTQLGGHPVTWIRDVRADAHLAATGRMCLQYDLDTNLAAMERGILGAWADADVERATQRERERDLLIDFRKNEAAERAAIARWRVLLLLTSEDDADMCWYDSGVLHFLVRDEDLRARDFRRTFLYVASH